MLYAVLTFWLLVIVFSAWGVHSLWSSLVKPKAVNTVLLPGTLVAQLGHVLGLLVTGNAVRNTSLMSKDEKGDPETETPETHGIPVIGPIVVGMLPLLACAVALYLAAATWGGSIISTDMGVRTVSLPQALPLTVAGVWQLMHDSISVMQNMVAAIADSDLPRWPTVLFLYLAVCLTVRMTPFEGNRRGAIGAIVLAGVLIWIVASMFGGVQDFILSSWPLLSFSVGMLLFLLLVSLLTTGIVGLIRILAKNE